MADLYPFFLIIFIGVFFSMAFRRMHVPWVVALIFGGILIGPHALDLFEITPTAEFIAQIGLMFLMFMAGLEARPASFNNFRSRLLTLSLINGIVPFFVGAGIALLFGYDLIATLLVGIIFVSSSIAVVIPSLERNNLMNTLLGQSVVMTSVIQDVGSLILLSVVLQNIDPVTSLPLWIFYPLIFVTLLVFRFLIPKVNALFTRGLDRNKDFFQQEFRTALFILLGTVIVFELLGLHSIVAAFFAGFVLSSSLTSVEVRNKIRTVSYGVFIPTFFILIGIKTDFSTIFASYDNLMLMIAIVGGSIISKFASGWFGARFVGFQPRQALLFAVSSIPQLSTTLAVAFTALSLDVIDEKLVAAMVALSVVTVIVSPLLMNTFKDRIQKGA